MARPSKLSPDQWREIERRAAAGESLTSLAREFGVSLSTVSGRVSVVSEGVRKVAHQVAQAQTALAALPVQQQYMAVNLAEKLRGINDGYALAAEVATRTGYMAHSLANVRIQGVDGAAPLSPESMKALQEVAVLTKIGNDALTPASNLLAANRERIKAMDEAGGPGGARPAADMTDDELAAIAGRVA